MTRLELAIDELVLVGFPPAERSHVAEEIERELARIAVSVHPAWRDGKWRSATPRPPAGVAVRGDGSVANQVADRISGVLAAGPRS
jgi:hypothetical protein